jgi:hypothetical protein
MIRVKRIVTTACAASFLLGWTGISSVQLLIPFRSAGTSVLLADPNNPKASYNQGYQLGRKDAKSHQNSDNRRQRSESSQWNSEFRRGYEDGYAGRSKNYAAYDRSRGDGIYDRSRNDDIYDRSRNDRIYDRSRNGDIYDRSRNDGVYDRSRNDGIYGRSGNDQSYSGPGTMTWRGRVDDYVELNIQGNRVRSRERQGSQTLNEQVSFSNPLPRANVTVSVRKRNGRGRVSVVQQPNQSNNYTAIVKIDDDKGGADDYEIEMEWR